MALTDNPGFGLKQKKNDKASKTKEGEKRSGGVPVLKLKDSPITYGHSDFSQIW